MSRINKLTIIFLILAVLLIICLIVFSQQINFGDNQDIVVQKHVSAKQNHEAVAFYVQEEKYLKLIEGVIEQCQLLLSSINGDIDKDKVNITDIKHKDVVAIEKIDKELKSVKVPSKYKDFHLLLSRSLANVNLYLNSANPQYMSACTDLFNQAKEVLNSVETN